MAQSVCRVLTTPVVFVVLFTQLDSVPKALDTPLLWDDSQLRHLGGTGVLEDVFARREFYKVLHTTMFRGSHGAPPLSMLAWALATILSRAVSGDGRPFTLVPLLDMVNHSSVHRNAVISFDGDAAAADGVLRLSVDAPVACGDQLFIAYGQHHNAKLLRQWGFAEAGNPHDAAPVELDVESVVAVAMTQADQDAAPPGFLDAKAEALAHAVQHAGQFVHRRSGASQVFKFWIPQVAAQAPTLATCVPDPLQRVLHVACAMPEDFPADAAASKSWFATTPAAPTPAATRRAEQMVAAVCRNAATALQRQPPAVRDAPTPETPDGGDAPQWMQGVQTLKAGQLGILQSVERLWR